MCAVTLIKEKEAGGSDPYNLNLCILSLMKYGKRARVLYYVYSTEEYTFPRNLASKKRLITNGI